MQELKLGDKCRLKIKGQEEVGIFVGINRYGKFVFFIPESGTIMSILKRDDFIILSSGKNDDWLKGLIDVALDIKDETWFLELTSLL